MTEVTQILQNIGAGDSVAVDRLLPLVYDELRKLAAARLAQEQPGQTLQPTALVHEAYLRLVDVDCAQHWTSRRHFFGAAAEAMRRILVDKARRRNRHKHGGDVERVALDVDLIAAPPADDLLESLDDALTRFQTVDPTACELVKLRYFAGLSLREAAALLDIPPRSADRVWSFAKAWLLREVRSKSADAT